MPPPPGPGPIPIETLLRETPWLRRLARELVRDPGRAEDLVQETLLSAIRFRGGDAVLHPRAWLRQVAQRHAWMLQRGDERRRRRELDLASGAASAPSASDALERLEMQRRLAEAIQALPSPDRDIVALRFVEGLPPRRIAERLGLTSNAVSTRLSRATARLRAELSREDPELRRLGAFAAGVALGDAGPAAVPAHAHGAVASSAASSAGVLVGATLMKKALAAAAVLLIAAWCVHLIRGEPSAPRSAHQNRHVAAPRPGLRDGVRERAAAPALAEPAGAGARVAGAPDPAAEPQDEPEAAAAPTGTILVRTVEIGTGAAATSVGLRVVRFGGSEYWNDVIRTQTGPDGTARIEALQPGRVYVYCKRPSRGSTFHSERVDVVPGETIEVTFRLDESAIIRGRVVDEAERPVPGAEIWMSDMSGTRSEGNVVARAAADGTFSIGYASDMQLVSARADGYAASRMVAPVFLPGERRGGPITLVVTQPCGAIQGLVVDGRGRPVGDALVVVGVSPDDAVQHGEVTTWGPPQRLLRTDAEGRFECRGFPPGPVPIQARAVGTSIARTTVHVGAGATAEARLQLGEAGAIRGTVRDAEGNVVEGVSIGLAYAGDCVLTRAEATSDQEGQFELRGIGAGATQLFAEEPKTGVGVEGEVLVRPGEVARWDIRLPALRAIRGQLVLGNGEHAEGWIVRGRAPGHEDEEMGRRFTRADAEGRFVLQPCVDAPFVLSVSPPGQIVADAILFVNDVQPDQPEHTIEVPEAKIPSAAIHGVVVGGDGAPESAEVTLRGGQEGEIFLSVETDADGRFAVNHLVPGPYELTTSVEGKAAETIQLDPPLGEGERRVVGRRPR